MPVYNERSTFEAAIEDALGADLPVEGRELIVVDDGSTDGTRELLQNRRRPDAVKVMFHDRNRGKGAAIHTALQHATGDFAAILDADLEYSNSCCLGRRGVHVTVNDVLSPCDSSWRGRLEASPQRGLLHQGPRRKAPQVLPLPESVYRSENGAASRRISARSTTRRAARSLPRRREAALHVALDAAGSKTTGRLTGPRSTDAWLHTTVPTTR
jgi:glycosyltransferase involved in cell wall biosynthesis